MAALMVPFGLKSLLGLYPESFRFLAYRELPLTPPGACANVGVAAVADSSTAAARPLNEIIVVFLLYRSVTDPRADKTRRSRFVRRACCPNASYRLAASDADAFGSDVGRDRSRSI